MTQQKQTSPQAATPLAAHHEAALKAAGVDWSKLQGLPWGQIIAIIQALLAALQQQQAQAKP